MPRNLPRLAASGLRKKLSFGLEPIGTGIAGEREPVPSFRNEVRAELNFLVGRDRSLSDFNARARLYRSDGLSFLSGRLSLFRNSRGAAHRTFPELCFRSGCVRLASTVVLVLSGFCFSWHG